MPTPTKYTYTISTDFPHQAENSDRLTLEIAQSAIVTALQHIDTADDSVDVWFRDVLSDADKAALDGLVASHSGDALVVENRDAKGNPVVATSVYGFVEERTRFKGYRYVATAGAVSIFDEKVVKQVFIQGGKASVTGANDGDYIEFAIVDKDDVLGLFAAFGLTVGKDVLEVDKYVQTYYPAPNIVDEIEHRVQAAGKVIEGLYLRLIYHSTGDTDPVTRVTYLWYESLGA